MKKRSGTCLAAGVMCVVSTYLLCATASAQDKDQAELAKALQGVRTTLEQGLLVIERSERTEHLGRPMSAKFEVEQGTLQLSVYMGQGNQFSEVIVDYKTGRVAKTEPITGGGDLAAARTQSEAMAKAKAAVPSGGHRTGRESQPRVSGRQRNSSTQRRSARGDDHAAKGSDVQNRDGSVGLAELP